MAALIHALLNPDGHATMLVDGVYAMKFVETSSLLVQRHVMMATPPLTTVAPLCVFRRMDLIAYSIQITTAPALRSAEMGLTLVTGHVMTETT
jgi:hypothetical protein